MERLAETVIIPAGPGDAAALARVHVQAWRETYRGLLPDDYLAHLSAPLHARRWRRQLTLASAAEVVLGAEGPAGLIGYSAGAVDARHDEQAEIFTLYLVRSAQGRGLGRRLLETTARVLRAQGARTLRLWVLTGNLRAEAFYDHMGGRRGGARAVRGWGGGLTESIYIWPDIDRLAAAGS